MNKLHKLMIDIWENEMYLKHPSYEMIAKDKRIKRHKSSVAKVIQRHIEQKKLFNLK